jgi:hypothetical protein
VSRLVGIVVAIVVVSTGLASADDKAFKPYVGKIVVSPDAPPTVFDELPRFLKINVQADGAYDVRKGPPWQINFVAVLSKEPGAKPVTLALADKADKNLTPMHSVALTAKRRVVIGKLEATVAASFAAHKTYVMRIMLGKTVLAKCEITLKD